jgi:iron complex transport system substrate-binding protein
MLRRVFLLVALLALLGPSSACRSQAHPRDLDASAAAPARVVSLSPSTTEAVAALGALSSLVGRSRYCDDPPEVKKLPEVGGYVDPNLEAIVALRPDLVVGARGPAGRRIDDTLRTRGIATYFPATESIDDIFEMIRGVGTRLQRPDRALHLVADIQARLAAVTAATKDAPHPRVLLLFGVEPIVAAGPKSFGDEILARAGAQNVVTSGGSYPSLDIEAVAALDPDVIVDAAVAEEHGGQRIDAKAGGWSRVRAVREGHVVPLSDESVLRPGPRVAEGVAVLARALHPGLRVP